MDWLGKLALSNHSGLRWVCALCRGKWASASAEEVAEMMGKGVPYCYRFRVPKNKVITIKVCGRGWRGG